MSDRASGIAARKWNAITLLICGLGIGILAGLSVSPVIGTVMSVVVGLAAGLLTMAQRFRLSLPPPARDPARGERHFTLAVDTPVHGELAIFIVGLVAGSMGGLYVRNHQWLGRPSAQTETSGQAGSKDEKVMRNVEPVSGLHANEFKGCANQAGKHSARELEDRLSRVNRRMAAFIAARRGQIEREKLVVLVQTFECSTSEMLLSADELDALRRDNYLPAVHPHALVAKLGEQLGDRRLMLDVVGEVLGSQ